MEKKGKRAIFYTTYLLRKGLSKEEFANTTASSDCCNVPKKYTIDSIDCMILLQNKFNFCLFTNTIFIKKMKLNVILLKTKIQLNILFVKNCI